MGPLLEKYEKASVLVIYESIQKGGSLLALRQDLKELCPEFLSPRECRALVEGGVALWRSAKNSYTSGGQGKKLVELLTSTVPFQAYEHTINEVHYQLEKKAKAYTVFAPIEGHRASSGVFYMVTIHQKPACGHKPWQGKIVIDRNWRSILGSDSEAVNRVEAYLKEHPATPRLQELMKEPVWLSTRRNCRHRFIPIPTYEVLTTSVDAIKNAHPEVHDHAHRSLTPKQVYAKKKARIRNVRMNIKLHTSVKVLV